MLRFSRKNPLRFSHVSLNPVLFVIWVDLIQSPCWTVVCFLPWGVKKGISYFDYFNLSLLLLFSTVNRKSKQFEVSAYQLICGTLFWENHYFQANEIVNNKVLNLFPDGEREWRHKFTLATADWRLMITSPQRRLDFNISYTRWQNQQFRSGILQFIFFFYEE